MPTNFLTGPADGTTWDEWEEELIQLAKKDLASLVREFVASSRKKTLLPPLGSEGKPYTFLDAVSRGNAGHIGFTRSSP